jgi:hypothetical protein
MMGMTYEVEVVLDDVALERLERQLSIPKTHDERVVDESVPDGFDVWAVEKVFDEVAPEARLGVSPGTSLQDDLRQR